MRSLQQSLPRLLRPRRAPLQKPPPTRPYTTPKPPNPTTTPPPSNTTTTRVERILARLPTPLQRYTSRLRGAPLTHVAAFLVLHELTAVVPLLGLFGVFHYTEWVPLGWMVAHYGGYVRDGVGRFERWFRRKGWFGFGEEVEGVGGERVVKEVGEEGNGGLLERWEKDGRYRVVVEVGLAYALTKVLLPVRIVGSLWATPWFAGVLGRLGRVVRRGA